MLIDKKILIQISDETSSNKTKLTYEWLKAQTKAAIANDIVWEPEFKSFN